MRYNTERFTIQLMISAYVNEISWHLPLSQQFVMLLLWLWSSKNDERMRNNQERFIC